MSSSDDEIAAAASEGVETLFSSDTSFEASLDAAQALARAAQDSVAASEARTQQHAHKQAPSHAAVQRIRLRARAVLSLARLPLNVLERIDGHVASAGKHGRGAKKRKARSEEEKAAEADIDAGLRAADAEALDVRKRYAKGALKAVVTVFFRVLRAPTHAELLPAVVRGLSKFAHLIDVGIVTDLLACLKQLVRASMLASSEDDSGKRLTAEGNESFSAPAVHLSVECALNCVLAALRIMAGPGQQLLNADETDFTRCLYGTLPRLVDEAAQSIEVEPASRDSAVEASSARQDSPVPAPLLAAHCVQALLLNRRELSSARVESFTRRLLTVAVHLPPAGSLALMGCVRGLANRYPAAARILSAPPATTSASSSAAAASDPTMLLARGAHSALFAPDAAQRGPEAVGWELGGLMLRHFHPAVRAAAAAASDNALLLPSESANAVFAAFDCDSTGAFNPPVRAPPPHPLAARLADAEKRAAASKSAGERHVRAFFIREPMPAGSLAAMADDGVLSLSDASCEADFARRKAAEAAHAVTIVAQVASAKASFDAAQRKLHAASRSARR
jgi:nucleolar complex protein 3